MFPGVAFSSVKGPMKILSIGFGRFDTELHIGAIFPMLKRRLQQYATCTAYDRLLAGPIVGKLSLSVHRKPM